MDKAELGAVLRIEEKRSRLEELNQLMADPNFWQDRARTTVVLKEQAALQKIIHQFDAAESKESLVALEELTLFVGPHDSDPAILSVYSGAGGTDAQDFSEMLLRMYQRFADRRQLTTTLLEQSRGEEAGSKSAVLRLDGPFAFGLLKGEAGVHRLVRLSPFNAKHLRQTSFALVDVVPEIARPTVELKEDEIRIDVYRAGGHGGQGVNTTDSAVRITHLPTGIVVAVQNERSQHQNKETALTILRSRLQLRLEEEQRAKTAALRGQDDRSAEFGSQIRNYVLHPYKLVKDLRTGVESSNPEAVLDGQLDQFVSGFLRRNQISNSKEQR